MFLKSTCVVDIQVGKWNLNKGSSMKKFICFVFFFIFLTKNSLVRAEMVESCFPKSDLAFTTNNKSLDGISESEFVFLIERAKNAMSLEIKKATGKTLVMNPQWNDPKVDAHATRDESFNPVVVINGGLARHPQMTRDGLLLIICHEIGHHLGGAPKSFRGNSNLRSWSSAEGEADYFATSKCLPRIFSDGAETKGLDFEIDTVNLKHALNKCKDDNCARISLAGLSVSQVFASLKVGTPEPQIYKNDLTVVTQTVYNHPNPQCRLDTYIAGAVCDVSLDLPFDNLDPRVGACLGNSPGARPRCWFKDSDF